MQEDLEGRTAVFELLNRQLEKDLKYTRQILQMLLRLGADLRRPDLDGRTVLHLACHDRRHSPLAMLLLKEGRGRGRRGAVDPNARDSRGETPLHVRCRDGREEGGTHSWAQTPRILRARGDLLHKIRTLLQWDPKAREGGGWFITLTPCVPRYGGTYRRNSTIDGERRNFEINSSTQQQNMTRTVVFHTLFLHLTVFST